MNETSPNPFSSGMNGSGGSRGTRGVSVFQDIEGGSATHQFRYSRAGFRYNLAVAVALTALFCGFIWLITGGYGTAWHTVITVTPGLIFFAFISARMLAQYWRDDVVLAIQPTGLYDGRIGGDTIPWDAIKELVVIRREQEFRLEVILWPRKADAKAKSHEVNLSALEGGAQAILEAINAYKPIQLEK